MPAKRLSKQARLHMLGEILRRGDAETQAQIVEAFRRRGYELSQVTVSRDLRDLGVAKVAGDEGRHYSLTPAEAETPVAGLERIVREFARHVEAAGQFVVVKTPPSGAQPVGLALDQAGFAEIAGVLSGDDTVFALARTPRGAAAVAKRLREFLQK